MIKLKLCVVAIGFSISGLAGAATNYPNQPVYDCTAEETKVYIEQVTHSVFAPSPITTPDAFQKAYVEAAEKKAAAGDDEASTCSTIFTDGKLSDDWKDAVDTVRNMDFGTSYSSMDGAILEELLKKAKEQVTKEVMGALEALGGDICKLMSSDSIKGMLLDVVNKKYGMNAQNLRLKDFANEVTEDQLLKADDDVLLLLSEDKLTDKIGTETKTEMRKTRKDIWDKF